MGSVGINVWYEFMADNVDAARAFYSEAIGWSTKGWGEGAAPYTMWMVGEKPVGGLMQLPQEAKAMGAPPHWMAYTTVADVDASCKQTQKLGGKILKPAFDIPTVGRVAILADPQGAAFAIFKPEGEMTPAAPNLPGSFAWAELNTTDHEAAWAFYAALFGWVAQDKMDMGKHGIYFMFADPSKTTMGGMSNMAKEMGAPPHWLHYATVEDIDAALTRIKQHGGEVVNGPMSVPGGGRVAQCKDPQGAFFAIFCPEKK